MICFLIAEFGWEPQIHMILHHFWKQQQSYFLDVWEMLWDGCVSFLLKLGAVETQCSERGISDVTAARNTEVLQLVASSAQTDQTFIRYLLEATDIKKHKTDYKNTKGMQSLSHASLSVAPTPLPTTKCLSYCARLHIYGGEFWAVFLKVFQCSVVQLG